MIYRWILFLISLSVLLNACGSDAEPFERIQKLRGLGVKIDPLIPLLGTHRSVQLNVFVAVPVELENIEAQVFTDKPSVIAPTSPEVVIESRVDEVYGKIRVLNITARAQVPSDTILVWNAQGEAQFRYGFQISAPGQESEKIVGSVLVVKDERSPLLNWTHPSIVIEGIENDSTVKKDVPIKASISNEQPEDIKAGWFVTSGEVKNRRSYDTQWQNAESGSQVLIGTVRGMKSRSFEMDLRQVVVE